MKKIFEKKKFFDKAGYFLVRDYVDDIYTMMNEGPWKLPIGYKDRSLLFLLNVITKHIWLAENLHIKYPYLWSPSYNLLLIYLKQKGVIDYCVERQITQPFFSSFTIKKQIPEGGIFKGLYSNGVAKDKDAALSKAVGEILERTVTGLGDGNKNIVMRSAKVLEENNTIFYPPKFHRFLPQQKKTIPILNLNEDSVIAWVEGENVITRKKHTYQGI